MTTTIPTTCVRKYVPCKLSQSDRIIQFPVQQQTSVGSDLGHRGLGEGIEQLGPVLVDAAVLLAGAGQEAGHVDEGDDGDIKAVAEVHESRPLDAGHDVQAARQHHGLVGDHDEVRFQAWLGQ